MGRRAAMNARKRNRRILYGTVVVAVVALIVVFYLIYNVASSDPLASYIGEPVSTTIMDQVTGVSYSTLSEIGLPSGVTAPDKLAGPVLTSGGVPEVLYVGGEFCPYCAVERWAIIVALSQFGTFSGLEYMQSSSTDVNPNTPTFTFANASYTSKYLTFVPVEEYTRTDAIRQNLTSAQSSLESQYDVCPTTQSGGGIPFVDVANLYGVNCGAQFSLDVSNQNWSTIASQLNDPSSSVASLIDGAANTLISAICTADTNAGVPAPTNPCSQSFASEPLAYVSPVPGNAQTVSLAVAPSTFESKWTA